MYLREFGKDSAMKELAFLVTYQDHCHFNWSSNVRKEIKL